MRPCASPNSYLPRSKTGSLAKELVNGPFRRSGVRVGRNPALPVHQGPPVRRVQVVAIRGCAHFRYGRFGQDLLREVGGPRREAVSMMQAAQLRDRNELAIRRLVLFDLASARSFFAKAEVASVLMIVGDVRVREPFQVAPLPHNHMVEQVPTAVAYEPLRDSVLPRALKAGSLGLNAKALDCINHIVTEVRATIKYEIVRGRVERKRLPQLLDHTRARWMPGHVEVKNTPPVMRDHEEAAKHAECHCRYGEEINRGDRLTVVVQEGCPTPCRLLIPGRLSHPA